jgi:hypothetical protein
MISLVDALHLEIISKSAMTCAKLKQLAQGMRGTVFMNYFNGLGTFLYTTLFEFLA